MGRFLFRCDISPQIGAGHLRRCMALADELKMRGSSVFFVLRTRRINEGKELEDVGDEVIRLDWSLIPEEDAQEVVRLWRQYKIDAAIVDHYHASAEYQQHLYYSGVRWLQFDGCVQKQLWADWVINPNLASRECDYSAARQRKETCFLLGPKYAFLRGEFAQWQSKANFRKEVKKILLTFGGGDDKNATVFSLDAIKSLDPSIERVILASSANASIPDIQNWMEKNPTIYTTLLIDDTEIARNMAEADLAITAGGMTTFETAAMGLPTLIIQIAENQRPNARGWHKEGIAVNLGPIKALDPVFLHHQVKEMMRDVKRRENVSYSAKALVDCLGARRVAQRLLAS
jgi:UDP-2,4-diacetamido-2,4,6-trideoxy-beta-L-altropyranose hydrolase